MGPLVYKAGAYLYADSSLLQEVHKVVSADGGNGTSVQSEDCLRINVIAPVNATDLPVYLYIQSVQSI